jgi:predicted dehydrogenase
MKLNSAKCKNHSGDEPMSSHGGGQSRRRFMANSAFGAGAAALSAGLAPRTVLGANDRVRVGAMGTGGRCRGLLNHLKKLPGNEIVALADVYEPNLLRASEAVGAGAKQYKDYRAILDDKEIDAVVIGSPDHWHKQMTVDAVSAGKDVYVEKPVTHKLEEGAELVRAVEASKCVVQTGTQQRSWEHFRLGKEIVDAGKLGQINFVRAWWYQNYAAAARPKTLQFDKLDRRAWLGPAPEQELTPMKVAWWRWYWDFGGGALTDLMTHWIDVVHWYMGTPAPLAAMTSGQKYILEWDCPDTVTCVLDYPKNYSVTYTGSMASNLEDGGLEIRGVKGMMKVDRNRLAFYAENGELIGRYDSTEPEILIRSRGDGTIDHLKNFLDCVRSRETPSAPVRVGVDAARAAHLGNLALRKQRRVKWDARQAQVES